MRVAACHLPRKVAQGEEPERPEEEQQSQGAPHLRLPANQVPLSLSLSLRPPPDPHPMDPQAGFSGLFPWGNLHISPKKLNSLFSDIREKRRPTVVF